MLSSMNREKAKKDFIKLAESSDHFLSLDKFSKFYPIKRDSHTAFEFYTNESFFYRMLNRALRKFERPEHLFYLRLPFSDMFLSIQEEYKLQQKGEFQKKRFECYRGGQISQDELCFFKESKG